MKKTKKRGRGSCLAIAVLVSLSLLSAVNLKLIMDPLVKWGKKEINFTGMVEQIQKGYTSDDFRTKIRFLNLNGAFAKLTGRRYLNEVVRCEDGELGRILRKADVTKLARSLSDFSEYLKEYNDIPFLYVQVPCKENLDGFLPAGIASYAQENTEELLAMLKAEGVRLLDLRPRVAQTLEQIERYYYKTDHHWNADGAFVAFQTLMEELGAMFPEENIDLEYTRPEQWERHEKEDWFLGSLGKRVGTIFGGTDPLIWYTPRFDTEMSCVVPKHKALYQGDFAAANIREQYIEEKNYYGYNAYCVYIGGDYPLVRHRNLKAPAKLRVLFLKDSFSLPLQAYLSTVFQEIDVIDPRHWTESTIAEYVEWNQPDIVIMATNPSIFANHVYRELGTAEMRKMKEGNVAYATVDRQDVKVLANNSNHNYTGIQVEPDSVYRVSFDGVNVLEGDPQGMGMVVYDTVTKKIERSTILDLNYCDAVGEYTWTFKTPKTDNELQLLFYAGVQGSTAGNSVIYRDVVLEKQGTIGN